MSDTGNTGMSVDEFITLITPDEGVVNPYSLKTQNMMQMHDGVAWTATLLKNGAPVGTVEDHGNGGAPYVYLKDVDEHKEWHGFLRTAYAQDRGISREENFVAFLTHTEDKAAMKAQEEAQDLLREILGAEEIHEEMD